MRLEGKAKGGYFPTPEPVLTRIANFLKVENNQVINALDPCCGTGRALAHLVDLLKNKPFYLQVWDSYNRCMKEAYPPTEVANAVRVTTYGIELEGVRSKEARSRIDEVLQASYFSTTISKAVFGLVLLNPPYDLDYDSGEQGQRSRLELTFLKRTTEKLMSGGILVYIVPQHELAPAARHLSENYKEITCYRFPDEEWLSPEDKARGLTKGVPMYDLFDQVVLFGVRKGYVSPDREMEKKITEWGSMGAALPVLPHESLLLDEYTAYTTYSIPREWDEHKVKSFAAQVFDPDRIAHAICAYTSNGGRPRQGVWSTREYDEMHWPLPASMGVSIGTPLAPFKKGHLAVLAASGAANGAELVGKDGRRLLIKGYSGKVAVTKTEEDDDSVTVTKTDKFVTALWGVDLDTGDLIYIETGAPKEEGGEGESVRTHETMTLGVFMENFGAALAEQVADANPPLFQSERGQLPWVEEKFKHLLRKPLGRQRDFILFMVNALVNGRRDEDITRVAKIAEMATGKTYLSLASSYIADEYAPCYPMIVLCPPILGRKWKREAEQTIPGMKAVLVRQLSTEKDAAEFRQFDPSFHGKELSSVGCLERAIAVIKADLAQYEKAMAKWEEERMLRKKAHKQWKATVWWQWKQTYVPGNWVNPSEPIEPDWEKKIPLRPKPVKPLHMVVLTSSVAKLGSEWEPVYEMKPLKVVDEVGKTRTMKDVTGERLLIPHCTRCGEPLSSGKKPKEGGKSSEEDGDEEEGVDTSEYLQERDMVSSGETRKKRWCLSCGDPLWQVSGGGDCGSDMVRSTARRRVALADYIRKRHKRFFQLLVSDEIHEGAEGTALFFARASLQEACVRSSGLTGTLCNGYASSVFPTFYGINPQVRKDFRYDDTKRWVDFYGIWQETRKESKKGGGNDGYDGAQSKRKVGKPQVSEKPGFSPQGLKYVLANAAFLELSDVAPWLPPFKEQVVEVPMDDILAASYRSFESTITTELGAMLVRGDMSGLSPWFRALLGYPSMPYLGWVCQTKYGHFLGEAEALPEQHVYNKERELIDLVQEEVNKGRRVMVYCEHTGEFDIPERLKKLLQHNVKLHRPLLVSKLYANTVSTINREQWLRDEVSRGCDVLICNPRLVKVGLDMIEFPTIVFFEVPMSTSDMRQASRRSYRPGQTLPVKVVYMVYPTMEYRMLALMAKKMQTSLAVEGQLPGEGLVSFGSSGDDDSSNMALRMAREIMATLQGEKEGTSELGDAGNLQEMFTSIAQAEYDQNAYMGIQEEEEGERQLVPVEPIMTRTLSTASYPGVAEIEVVEVVCEKPSVKKEEVVIIPISRITDPWEALRQKVEAEKGNKRKRRAKVAQVGADLWGFSSTTTIETTSIESELVVAETLL